MYSPPDMTARAEPMVQLIEALKPSYRSRGTGTVIASLEGACGNHCSAEGGEYRSRGTGTVMASLEGACGKHAARKAGRVNKAAGGHGKFAGVSMGNGHAPPEGDWVGMEYWVETPSDVAGEIDGAGSDTDSSYPKQSGSVIGLLSLCSKKPPSELPCLSLSKRDSPSGKSPHTGPSSAALMR